MRSLIDTFGKYRFGGKYIQGTKAFFVLLVLCFFCPAAHAQYGGGTGTQNDPYLIRTAEQMNAIGATQSDWSKHFRLRADIDMSEYTGTAYNIIGTDRENSFSGTFDGNDHKITGFSLTSARQRYTGLFGYVTGEVINLGLINPEVIAQGSYVGALAGYLDSGTVTSCYAKGASVSGDDYIGGLVGTCTGSVYKSYSSGSVIGDMFVGGLIGFIDDSTVTTSFSKASVTGHREVGGLAGRISDETRYVCRRARRTIRTRQSLQMLFNRQCFRQSIRRRRHRTYKDPRISYA
jgi:hypothetical protein